MKILLKIFLLVMFLGSCDENDQLPAGFEHVSMDGRTHFVYVSEKFWGDRVTQKGAARTICQKLYQHADYCEVYFYSDRNAIPKKFPIINRTESIGFYQAKEGRETFKALK